MSDDLSDLRDFNGRTRLFPLPNLVFFPQVMQPLHIFEPRYRQMAADALAGDHLISLVMLQAGWDKGYEGSPGIYSIACLGKIVADQRLKDGRFNLLLRGLSRVRILREVHTGKLYRSAEVEVLRDVDAASPDQETLRQLLLEFLPALFPQKEGLYDQLKKAVQSPLSLGEVADILTFALPLSAEVKQRQLEELSVQKRVECLLDYAAANNAKVVVERTFPPEFSVN